MKKYLLTKKETTYNDSTKNEQKFLVNNISEKKIPEK